MSKYNYLEVEAKHQKQWEEWQTYAYQPSSKKKPFVIDTPPPTVSGALHIGHIFSYTQTDILARFHRMQGKNVFYPMGWDDNGLPTEKRVQNLYAVKCDPKLAYDPNFQPKKTDQKTPTYQSISRKNFLELCESQVLDDEVKYKKLWSHIALSVDWNQSYRSIDSYSQSLAQFSFLDLYNKGLVSNRLSPVLWDTQFQTAVAQADIEDRAQKGFYHDIAFLTEGGDQFVISTTRPELIPACVAVSAHPEDKRYKKLFGQTAITPLFHRAVPIIPSTHADPEKGTGILMICTFGDMEDVAFCEKHKLPFLQVIDEEGFFKDVSFEKGLFQSQKLEEARSNYSNLKGLRVKPARKKIVEILKEKGLLKSEPKACEQFVKFYEKGEFPLEILAKRQWYINVLDHKEDLLRQGKKIQWHPPSMRKRYEQWVEGLNQDWCISRQRPYGVPFPVWYKLDDKGEPDYKKVILPEIKNKLNDESFLAGDEFKKQFPIDPLQQTPKDFSAEQRDQAGGFCADSDVMDTWATSSLTPYINSGWILNSEKHQKLFPADLRPQAHEIIRTWAFYTIAKAYFHEKQIPWKNIAVSGWVVTPNRMKMSKSKGNALTPENLIETYSADAIRYWAAKAKLGQDTVYDENLFKMGKRLATKIFNAGRFVYAQVEDVSPPDKVPSFKEITVPIDQAYLYQLLQMRDQSIKQLKNYEYAEALDSIEKNFWSFCDNYLELVKSRVYKLKDQAEGLSGKKTLDYSFYTFLKLFAPYLPYVTEELWQARYSKESSSIHKAGGLDGDSLSQKINLSKLPRVKEKIQQSHYVRKTSSMKKTASMKRKTASIPDDKDLDRGFLSQKKTHLKSIWKNIVSNLWSKEPAHNKNFLNNPKTAFAILEQVRSEKSKLNKSLASTLKSLEVTAQPDHLKEFMLYKEDIARASHVSIQNIFTKEQKSLEQPLVQITLEDAE